MIEPFKYLIQAVAIERDEMGRVVAEHPFSVVSVYSAEQAKEAVEQLEAQIQGGGSNGANPGADGDDHLRRANVPGHVGARPE